MQNESQNGEHRHNLYSDVLKNIRTGSAQGNISALLAFIDNSPLVKDDKAITEVEIKFNEARNKIKDYLAGCAEALNHIKIIDEDIKKQESAIDKINDNIKNLSEEASEIILAGGEIDIEKQRGLAYIAGGEIAINKINKIISVLQDKRNEASSVLRDIEEGLRTSKEYASSLYAEIQARKFFLVAGCLITRIYDLSPSGSHDGNFNPESWDCNVFSDLLKTAKNINNDNSVTDDVLKLASEYKFKSQRYSPFSLVIARTKKTT